MHKRKTKTKTDDNVVEPGSIYNISHIPDKILKHYGEIISDWRKRKGFHTPNTINNPRDAEDMLGKLMLVVSELAEAAEAVRHTDINNFVEEIADTFIRLFDICGSMNIDIEAEIDKKMIANEQRPIRHGKNIRL